MRQTMSENPFQSFFNTVAHVSHCLQNRLSQFISLPNEDGKRLTVTKERLLPLPIFSATWERKQPNSDPRDTPSILPSEQLVKKETPGSPVTKEELGRATWTFLHTLAAQYPDKPTRQQKKDVKELMAILSRMYPYKDCADHFKEVLRANPVEAGSQSEFSQWLCHAHNVVNRSLAKPMFPYERVDARWGKLECEQRACDLWGENDPWA